MAINQKTYKIFINSPYTFVITRGKGVFYEKYIRNT